MKRLSKEYYAGILGINPDSVEDVTSPRNLPIDENVHRSRIYIVGIKNKDGSSTRLLHKVITEPEFKFADYYEGLILSASYTISNRMSNLHYATPNFLGHIPDHEENTLIMQYIEGDSLADKIKTLDKQLNVIENELRHNDKSDRKKRLYWDKLDVINEVKKAFIKLALRGLVEFQYFSKLNIEDIKTALERKNNELGISSSDERLGLYDPLIKDSEDHYKNRIISNLKELLHTYGVKYDEYKLMTDLLTLNPIDGKVPIKPLLEMISSYDKERIIVSDYHPLHIIPMHNEEINSQIEEMISIEPLKKFDEKELDFLTKRIAEEGKVFITDLGDARIGPELFDFVDLTRNHICNLKDDEVDDLLLYFLRERQHLRSQDVRPSDVAKYHNDFLMIDTYRALRAAVKSKWEWQKSIYLQHLIKDLGHLSALAPLENVLLGYVELALEKIDSIQDEINDNKNTLTLNKATKIATTKISVTG